MGGYSAGAPWHFKGKALYQLSLVRVEEVSYVLVLSANACRLGR